MISGNLNNYFISKFPTSDMQLIDNNDRIQVLEEIQHHHWNGEQIQETSAGCGKNLNSYLLRKFKSQIGSNVFGGSHLDGNLPLRSLSEEEVQSFLSKLLCPNILKQVSEIPSGEKLFSVLSLSDLNNLGFVLPPIQLQKLFKTLKECRSSGVPVKLIWSINIL